MSLSAGTRLGPYEIVAPIGAGGMGEVYRAKDTKLNRDVAIKVLPESFALDADRVARFTREAQVLASLNHPNIAAIYGIEESGSTRAIVMELVEGEDLSAHISRGAIALSETLPIAKQIIDALEAAHEQGIVHRDLKPANIKVREDGTVKVLDFGLAKALGPEGASASADAMNSPTMTARATQMGMIIGTAAYMSPEQARGRAVDKRTDVWAFGCVLFEMLSGTRAFDGEDVTEMISAVMKTEPDWTALPATLPQPLRTIVMRCLVKNRKARIPDISVVRYMLDEGGASATAVPAPAAVIAPVALWRRVLPIVATALIAGGAVWAFTHLGPEPKAQPVRFTVFPAAKQTVGSLSQDRVLAISPDGTHIAYVVGAGGGLVVRAIDQLETQLLPGTANARQPFFSPDGQWIGFFQNSNELRKISVTGGPSILISRTPPGPRGASWGSDDTIIFATQDSTTGLMSISAGGGEPKVLSKPDQAHGEQDHQHPFVLPGARAVLFTTIGAGPNRQLSAEGQVAVLDLKTGATKTLVPGGSQPEYVASIDNVTGRPKSGGPGYLVYASAGTLRAVRFDPERLEVLSDPLPVEAHVAGTSNGAAQFAVSRTGTLVFLAGSGNGTEPRTLVWLDRKGVEEPIKAAPLRPYYTVRLSPDGTRLAMEIQDQDDDIWIWHFGRETLTRLTLDPARDSFPIWTPDSTRVVFTSPRGGDQNLFWQAADGTGPVERLTTSDHTQTATSFAPDGASLIFRDGNGASRDDLTVLSMNGQRTLTPLIHSPFNDRNGEVSPDGKWLAYESDESGPSQIYIRPFPRVNDGHWQISTRGGVKPFWAPGGHELFYVFDNALYSVAMPTTPSTAGNPVKLFDFHPTGVTSGRSFDISRDGKRFIAIKPAESDDPLRAAAATSINVVVNWLEELKSKVPLKK